MIIRYINFYLYKLLYYYMDKKTRVTKSLKIDPDLWIDVKVHCAKIQEDISDFVSTAIKKELKGNK